MYVHGLFIVIYQQTKRVQILQDRKETIISCGFDGYINLDSAIKNGCKINMQSKIVAKAKCNQKWLQNIFEKYII